MQESPGLKPDWLGKMSSLSMALHVSLSNTLLTTGSRETGQKLDTF